MRPSRSDAAVLDDATLGVDSHQIADVVDLQAWNRHGRILPRLASVYGRVMNDNTADHGVLVPGRHPPSRRISRPTPSASCAMAAGCVAERGASGLRHQLEANSLSVEEKIELLDRLVSAGVDPADDARCTGCCAITDSVRLTAHAVKLGCGGVHDCCRPFYTTRASATTAVPELRRDHRAVGESRLARVTSPTSRRWPRCRHARPGGAPARGPIPRGSPGMKDTRRLEEHPGLPRRLAKGGFDVFPGAESSCCRACATARRLHHPPPT